MKVEATNGGVCVSRMRRVQMAASVSRAERGAPSIVKLEFFAHAKS